MDWPFYSRTTNQALGRRGIESESDDDYTNNDDIDDDFSILTNDSKEDIKNLFINGISWSKYTEQNHEKQNQVLCHNSKSKLDLNNHCELSNYNASYNSKCIQCEIPYKIANFDLNNHQEESNLKKRYNSKLTQWEIPYKIPNFNLNNCQKVFNPDRSSNLNSTQAEIPYKITNFNLKNDPEVFNLKTNYNSKWVQRVLPYKIKNFNLNNHQDMFNIKTSFDSKFVQLDLPCKLSISKKSFSEISFFENHHLSKPFFAKSHWIKKCLDTPENVADALLINKILPLNNLIKEYDNSKKNNKCYYQSSQSKNKNRQILVNTDNIVDSLKPYIMRHFSSSKILYYTNDDKENVKEQKSEKTWTKQINNCRITYKTKRENNTDKLHYTVECKENGKSKTYNNFSGSNNLTTGQKLIGAVLSLLFVIIAAYSTVFIMSIAAIVVAGLAVLVFISTVYQILKKGWKSKKK